MKIDKNQVIEKAVSSDPTQKYYEKINKVRKAFGFAEIEYPK